MKTVTFALRMTEDTKLEIELASSILGVTQTELLTRSLKYYLDSDKFEEDELSRHKKVESARTKRLKKKIING